ncbi:hypothetical protein BKA66DRAFT_476284 [Pyrenochaeta sp. MPI-SDFR-AT-0127]|nr:hypothetical protein BKA66DRAFT_476284 [Pyrenochaeta sp. MPI-SDFR-AT-0127]
MYSTSSPRKYLYECSFPQCGRTFGRAVDFDRHFNGAHASEEEKMVFWCPIIGCNRSEKEGNRAFPRKDKVGDHLRQAHMMSYHDATMMLRTV